ncbi:unnamed protein product [Cercospora beticola]|nr:unnamed protein product [Cercospora beticola]
MADATRHNAEQKQPQLSSFQLDSQHSRSLSAACEEGSRLRRELEAFQNIQDDLVDGGTAAVLLSLDWAKLRGATVVEVGAKSITTAYALAEKASELQVVIQLQETAARQHPTSNGMTATPQTVNARVQVRERSRGAPQPVQDAAVYVLHLPGTSLTASSSSLREQILRELRAHFNVLRVNRSATLILVARLLPGAGQHFEQDPAAAALVQDLLLMQMTNEREWDLEMLTELLDEVSDASGRMVITHNHSSREKHSAAVVEVQLRPRSANEARVL